MKTEAIRYCIQARFGKEDYAEARLELTALETEINRLAAFNESMQTDARKNTETINKLKKALTDIRETYVGRLLAKGEIMFAEIVQEIETRCANKLETQSSIAESYSKMLRYLDFISDEQIRVANNAVKSRYPSKSGFSRVKKMAWAIVEKRPTQLAPDKGQAAVVKDNLVIAPCG